MTTLLEFIEKHKDSDGEYLQVMNALKQIHEKQNTSTEEAAPDEGRIQYHISVGFTPFIVSEFNGVHFVSPFVPMHSLEIDNRGLERLEIENRILREENALLTIRAQNKTSRIFHRQHDTKPHIRVKNQNRTRHKHR